MEMKMSQDPEKKLTLNDPVSPDDLQRLAELQHRRLDLGDTMLDLEQEKVKVLVQARQLDDQKSQLFTKLVTERGLPAGFPVEVDAKTGIIKALTPQGPNGAPDADGEGTPAPEDPAP
jgi:hypothetical protein